MRAQVLLVVGSITGIILASSDLLSRDEKSFYTENVVATVNGTPIPKERLSSITQSIEQERKETLSQEEYQFILEKLIDEELMVQRAQEMGLLQLNSTLRNNMRLALIESIIAQNAMHDFDDEDLRRFYKDNPEYFTPAQKLRIRLIEFGSQSEAEEALNDLNNGYRFDVIKNAAPYESLLDVPDALLSLNELQNYIGPSLTKKISFLKPGASLSLISNGNKWYIVEVIENMPGEAPEFSEIKEFVTSEYIRKRNEQTVSEYLVFLRTSADIDKMPIENLHTIKP